MPLAVGVTALSLVSCNVVDITTDNPNIVDEVTTHTCKMIFNGEISGFDGVVTKTSNQTKATTSSSWKDGDIVYITFYNGTTRVPGQATYTTAGGWSVSYDGDLSSGTGLKCEVRYFANATFQSPYVVSLNSATEIYEALSGTYDYSGNSITVTATMMPKTGRIRFSGTASSVIYLTGITVYTTFAPANNAFSTSSAMIKSTVASTGYTPYIYGYLSDSERNLGLVGSDFAFTRTCSPSVLNAGDSGYMAIPSDASHNNWRSGLCVKVGSVEFKMIPVAGLSSGFFMIGETEVTNALYKAVVTSSSVTSNNKPIVGCSYSTYEAFITQLNSNTNLTFFIPSAEQWKYAAKGGNKSQGYRYSGSNAIGDVAWYAGNSGGTVHDVKSLAPNELGIYDMCGNAFEFTSSQSYYSEYFDYYGGYYGSSESEIGITSKSSYKYYSNSAGNVGLRLALTCE